MAASRVEEIERVEWLNLGMPEAIRVCRVKDFDPWIISIDTKGKNLFYENKASFNAKEVPAVEKTQ